MRRIALTAGSLMAAAMLALAVPGSAVAADGVLVINGMAYEDPSGCYDSHRWPLSVGNYTNQVVFILSEPGCSGEVLELVNPDEQTVSELGASVYVD
ncbi:hypothetical protein [Streptomyces sp. NPDC059063]|uniref:hypothetical protein n=1 Tax=unclassified Streptomyces TaxID=2593676 RepID=UPI0036C90990